MSSVPSVGNLRLHYLLFICHPSKLLHCQAIQAGCHRRPSTVGVGGLAARPAFPARHLMAFDWQLPAIVNIAEANRRQEISDIARRSMLSFPLASGEPRDS
jgi:hypothetical protein